MKNLRKSTKIYENFDENEKKGQKKEKKKS